MKTYHLTYTGQAWRLKLEEAKYSTRVYKTNKKTAVKNSSFLLISFRKPSSLKIHKLDGTIEEERTYPRSVDPKTSYG